MNRIRSIRSKLIGAAALLVGIAVAGFGVLSFSDISAIYDRMSTTTEADLRGQLHRVGIATVQTAADSVRPFLDQSNDEDLRRTLVQLARRNQEIRAMYVLDRHEGLIAHSDERKNPTEGHPRIRDTSWRRVVTEWALRAANAPRESPLIASLPHEEGGERLTLFALPIFPPGAPEIAGSALDRDLPPSRRPYGYVVVAYSLASLEKALLDLQVEEDRALRSSAIRSVLVGLLCALIGVVIAVLLGVRIARPIQALSSHVQSIAGGDFGGRVEVASSDEIGLLASNFNLMAAQLEDLIKKAAEKARLENEIAVARSMQQLLVPQPGALVHPRIDLSAFYSPAAECGGDWWTFHELDADRTVIVIGDVMGQGVPAAVLTASAKAACDVARLASPRLDCAHLLSCINFALHEASRGGLLMTAFAAILDHRRGVMTYANAGHCPPMMLRKDRDELGELTLTHGPGALLGLSSSLRCQVADVDIRPGDLLVLYTDGLVESSSPSRQIFGKRRLRELMRRSADLAPSALRDAIVGSMREFAGEEQLKDDVTIVVARIV